MKRQQRIEALEYFTQHHLTIYGYHHTKKASELTFDSEHGLIDRAMFNYLYSGKLICRFGWRNESRTAHLFMLSTKGHQKLKQLKGKHEYFNQKKK